MLAATAAVAVILLCLSWLLLLARALRHTLPPREAAIAALAWATPFALGPPLFSRDVYAYAAQGELARHGLDPATHGVSALLARGPTGEIFVAAVDPRWRETHAPYGGLGVGVERLAATLGDLFGAGPAGAIVVLRVVAVLSTVALVLLALRLLRAQCPAYGAGSRLAVVLVLLAANPFVIIHLVGGSHLDALAAALLAGALVADQARRATTDTGRARGLAALAMVLACLAGSVKATAFLGAGWLLFAHLRDARRVRTAAAALGTDLIAGSAALLAAMAAGGFGPTWINALATSGALETGVAPASMLATGLAASAGLIGLDVADGTVLDATRALTLALAGLIVVWLALRTWPHPRPRDGLAVLGYGGMAVALGSPVVYPWYLALSVPFLAVLVALDRAEPPPRAGPVVWLVVVTSVWLCAATLSPLADTWRLLGRAGPLPVVALAVLLGGMALAAAGWPRWSGARTRRR
ncbi:polyprenol phosphomannose-dependent alpha 1,6 mannosyltransferase MptB [Parafrankia colletiae]|uniref:polyprenol phosphomannose-dependent alpha 1,6 mannosyltransferase MptB n=1 Tax=Parafrankia colletiae TaxID=573497 RepID=UPI001F52014E|nr:polyprenol phosphomannose-dependent alpha 1,6 mannosyltransferase MptB [Parafrankia colletiae]